MDPCIIHCVCWGGCFGGCKDCIIMFPKLDIWHSLSTYTDCPTAASAFNDLPFRNKEKQFFKLSALPLKDLFGFVFMLWIFFMLWMFF